MGIIGAARSDGVAEHRVVTVLNRAVGRSRTTGRPRWWQEIAFIVAIYGLYTVVRDHLPSHDNGAYGRARTVLSIERWLHIDIEHSVNSFVAGQHWLAYICDYYYATLHFIITIGVLIWLYVKHPTRYRAIRSVLIIINLVALIGFWFISLAPPRMLRGYVDTVVVFHTWGSLASPDVQKASNQFAAMPSLHIGWSLWCAVAIITLAKRPWVRVLGGLYPIATVFVIIGTANHFVLDAVGGAVTVGIAVMVQRLISGRRTFRQDPDATADAQEERELVPV